MKKIVLSLSLIFATLIGTAQHAISTIDHVRGQLLISLKPNVSPAALAQKYRLLNGVSTKLEAKEQIAEAMNIWLYSFDYQSIEGRELLQNIRREPTVNLAQFNHFVEDRKKPNDPLYGNQWQWNSTTSAHIKAEQAWDITTGGLTSLGDSIVVAVIDSGIDYNNTDFAGNIWFNKNEIPNNQIDDDGNGYVDDYRGWNAQDKNDNNSYTTNAHGTNVSGMIGAKGNNGIGTTGVNWDVKIMMVKASSSWLLQNSEVNVLAAYAYILKMRKLYNETKGQKGAFIVASNASWGRDNGKPDDSPLWCQFYDTLGVHGIMNCGATSNSKIHIDVNGDLPTACPSDYLISVQASNKQDINSFSGYGVKSIDIAAPGDGIYTAAPNNSTTTTTGTSFASPIVAGAIALIYAAPSKIMKFAQQNPASAALLTKDAILQGVDIIPALKDQNATSGRINLYNALVNINNLTSDCAAPNKLTFSNVSDKQATISFVKSDSIKTINLSYRIAGTTPWISVKNITSPFTLNALTKCTSYEVQLEVICAKETNLSTINTFKTDGCCQAPSPTLVSVAKNSATLTWNSIFSAQKYEVRYRKGLSSWTTLSSLSTTYVIKNLDSCSSYEVQVRTICDTTQSSSNPFSPNLSIKTVGCGACIDLTYCTPTAIATFEWIKSVKLNTLSNTSVGSANGFSLSTKKTTLNIGSSYNLQITPGYQFSSTNVHFMAWIDFNQDGDFNDEYEEIFDAGKVIKDSVTTTLITIPWAAKSGSTRLRIGMRGILGNNQIVKYSPCDNSNLPSTFYGEFEDYCVNLNTDFIPCPTIQKVDFKTASGIIDMNWTAVSGALGYHVDYREAGTTDWKTEVALSEKLQLKVKDCIAYDFRIKTICQNDLSAYSTIETVKSYCIDANDVALEFNNLKVTPNPFSDILQLSFNNFSNQAIAISLFNSVGQKIFQHTENQHNSGYIELKIEHLSQLPQGVYFIKIENKKGSLTQRIVKL